jgi:predicted metal-dependent hydrolase
MPKKGFKQTDSTSISIGEKEVPVFLIRENRGDCRVSIGRTGIRMRMPFWLSETEIREQSEEFLVWARQTIEKKGLPGLDEYRTYRHGETIPLYGQDHQIEIWPNSHKNSVRIRPGILQIRSVEGSPELSSENLSKAVAKAASRRFRKFLEDDVAILNERHFQMEYQKIRIKNNRSNWGSCSHKGNLNFNVRLFLAPYFVRDYIIIHELAHLIELNHSTRFWDQVRSAMPDYKEAEKLLRKNEKVWVF